MFNLLNMFKTKKNVNKKGTNKGTIKGTTKKIYGKSNKELCKKYLGKSVRGTPKNWAYNKCIKRNKWESCKTLPPAGYGMHRYFCE